MGDRKIDLNQFMDPEDTPDDVDEEKEERKSAQSKASKVSKRSKRTKGNSNDDGEEGGLLIDYLERISLDKRQCIRYCYGADPLLPHKIAMKKIPECEGCGKRLVFEFQ